MSGLKDIKNRISAISSNMKITSAMKMVSASKFRKSVDKMHGFQIFEHKFDEIKNAVLGVLPDENVFIKENQESNKILIIAVASNRGLCGPFNVNISKRVNILIDNDFRDFECEVISISKKVFDLLKNKLKNIQNREELLEHLSYSDISSFSESIIGDFTEGKKYNKVVCVYNSFKNASVQIIKNDVVLPIPIDKNITSLSKQFIFEPNKEDILEYLLPQMVKLNIFRILLESIASEHGARMTAMHKATENAKELQKNLNLEYNKIRQASITNQIIEIVSGASAV